MKRSSFFDWDKNLFALQWGLPKYARHMLRSPSGICLRYDCFCA
jgi:hypothetical protein